MILQLVGTAIVLGVSAFLTWERHDMAVTYIHAELRTMKATDIAITRDWFDRDHGMMSYDVEYTAANGDRKRNSCRLYGGRDADAQIFWADPI